MEPYYDRFEGWREIMVEGYVVGTMTDGETGYIPKYFPIAFYDQIRIRPNPNPDPFGWRLMKRDGFYVHTGIEDPDNLVPHILRDEATEDEAPEQVRRNLGVFDILLMTVRIKSELIQIFILLILTFFSRTSTISSSRPELSRRSAFERRLNNGYK